MCTTYPWHVLNIMTVNGVLGWGRREQGPLELIKVLVSGVSRISFRGGGSNFFWKSGGICMHGAKRHAARGEATRLLGGSGACSPEKIFKNGAIWCVLESILLKFCQKII